MKCPNDQSTLALTHREGVEIDYCPECRGIWLDRGELDKLIAFSEERNKTSISTTPRNEHNYEEHNKSRDYDGNNKQSRQKKREGFFGDLFDF